MARGVGYSKEEMIIVGEAIESGLSNEQISVVLLENGFSERSDRSLRSLRDRIKTRDPEARIIDVVDCTRRGNIEQDERFQEAMLYR
jgi:hypothetical protein